MHALLFPAEGDRNAEDMEPPPGDKDGKDGKDRPVPPHGDVVRRVFQTGANYTRSVRFIYNESGLGHVVTPDVLEREVELISADELVRSKEEG